MNCWALWALPCCAAVGLTPVLGHAGAVAASSVRAGAPMGTTFCMRAPARGQIMLVPQPRDAPPLVRFVVRGLPSRTVLGLLVDQDQDRGAYNITFGVRSDQAGSLVRAVHAFRRPEKVPRRLLLASLEWARCHHQRERLPLSSFGVLAGLVVHPVNPRHLRSRTFRRSLLVFMRELRRRDPTARRNGTIGTYRMDHLARQGDERKEP